MKTTELGRPGCSQRGPECPSSEVDSGPKGTKTVHKAEVCMFASCKSCSGEGQEALHRVVSDKMGHTLLKMNVETQDDLVRTSLSDLFHLGDATAPEKQFCTLLKRGESNFRPSSKTDCYRHPNSQFGFYCRN